MSTIRDEVRKLQSRSKKKLKALLAEELSEVYSREITNSLRNDFMEACCRRIDPDGNPYERVRAHENYSPSWSTKRQLATALRMLLTERVDRPIQESITTLDKSVLAEIIVAIRVAKGDISIESEPASSESESVADFLSIREERPERRFEDILPAESISGYELYRWITQYRSPTDGEHGVYVLDCTPPVGEEESSRMKALRQQAHRKSKAEKSLSKIEQAAEAANNGQRIYYVGYAADVPIRVRQHIGGASSGGAKFTNIFKPQALVDVSWYQKESVARKNEHRRSEELTILDQSYAYSE